jgi:hypothetical protein
VKRALYGRNVLEHWIVERGDPAGVPVLSLEGAAHVAGGWSPRRAVVRSRAGRDLQVPADETLHAGP